MIDGQHPNAREINRKTSHWNMVPLLSAVLPNSSELSFVVASPEIDSETEGSAVQQWRQVGYREGHDME